MVVALFMLGVFIVSFGILITTCKLSSSFIVTVYRHLQLVVSLGSAFMVVSI